MQNLDADRQYLESGRDLNEYVSCLENDDEKPIQWQEDLWTTT